MIKINLLPWRETLREEQKIEFLNYLGASAMLAGVILISIHVHFSNQEDYQKKRNQLLEKEITALEQQIASIKDIEEKKSQLFTKIEAIQKLQESRPEVVHLFDEIPHLVSNQLFLTKLTRKGADLTFEGKSYTNEQISLFMRNIEKSKWLTKPSLKIIQKTDKSDTQNLSDFVLQAMQMNHVQNVQPQPDNKKK